MPKRASEDDIDYGRRASAGAGQGDLLPLRCPGFRGHCCAQIQSQTDSSDKDGGSTGEGLSQHLTRQLLKASQQKQTCWDVSRKLMR